MIRSRPFLGSLAFRLLLLAAVPFVPLVLLANERISGERDHKAHADALVEVIQVRRATVSVYGPKNVERIAMEGLARVDQMGLPRPLVVAATGVDFETLDRENHAEFERTLDNLQTGCGDLVLPDGSLLGPRMAEVRQRLDTLRSAVDRREGLPDTISAAFDDLDDLLSAVLELDGEHGTSGSNSEAASNERLRALATVVDSAGGRGGDLLASILYTDPDRVYDAVEADGRHAGAAEHYRNLLDDDETVVFDAVRSRLAPLSPALIETVRTFDIEAFDADVISAATDVLDNQRSYLLELDAYANQMHAEMQADAEQRSDDADRELRQTWLLLFAIGGITLALVVAGSATTLSPLRRLTLRAQAISAGNITAEPLPVRGSNDIRALTSTTNEMSAVLAKVELEVRRLADGSFESGPTGDLPGAIGITLQDSMNRLQDITHALQRSEQMASAIVAGAGEAIWTIDGSGTILTANDASAQLLGVPADVQQGHAISDFLSATTGTATTLSSAAPGASLIVSSSRIESGDDAVSVVIAHDISERLDFEQQLALQARRDPLTGLPNRLAVLERIRELIATSTPAAVLYLDLDGFKSVNDLRGHRTGDEVLAEVGRRLTSGVATGDLVGRLGGDEFVVVSTTMLDHGGLAEVGSRLIGLVEQPFNTEDLINLSASIGVVMLAGHTDAEGVISEADSALYQAKHRGKGRLEVFDPSLQAEVAHRTELEYALRKAIPAGELVLHLQPIIDLESNRIDGAEALVRWDRPGHGLVPPNDFIPLAERSSLIIDLDRWVIERCCERLAAWRTTNADARLRLAVNISGRHLMEGNLVADIDAALTRTGADPSMLEVELTETHLLGDLERAVASLASLRERGVRVSIDDFGTGYSAMNYLRQLPIDAIKIDRSFVVAATGSASDASVVDAVMAIGRSNGLEVVAEGIETPAHLDFMRLRGCNRAQGFLIARPMPADEAEAMLLGQLDASVR